MTSTASVGDLVRPVAGPVVRVAHSYGGPSWFLIG